MSENLKESQWVARSIIPGSLTSGEFVTRYDIPIGFEKYHRDYLRDFLEKETGRPIRLYESPDSGLSFKNNTSYGLKDESRSYYFPTIATISFDQVMEPKRQIRVHISPLSSPDTVKPLLTKYAGLLKHQSELAEKLKRLSRYALPEKLA